MKELLVSLVKIPNSGYIHGRYGIEPSQVRGILVLQSEVRHPLKLEKVSIKFIGQHRTPTNETEIAHLALDLLDEDTTKLEPGRREIPFSFVLPSNLPPTHKVISTLAHRAVSRVKYSIVAKVVWHGLFGSNRREVSTHIDLCVWPNPAKDAFVVNSILNPEGKKWSEVGTHVQYEASISNTVFSPGECFDFAFRIIPRGYRCLDVRLSIYECWGQPSEKSEADDMDSASGKRKIFSWSFAEIADCAISYSTLFDHRWYRLTIPQNPRPNPSTLCDSSSVQRPPSLRSEKSGSSHISRFSTHNPFLAPSKAASLKRTPSGSSLSSIPFPSLPCPDGGPAHVGMRVWHNCRITIELENVPPVILDQPVTILSVCTADVRKVLGVRPRGRSLDARSPRATSPINRFPTLGCGETRPLPRRGSLHGKVETSPVSPARDLSFRFGAPAEAQSAPEIDLQPSCDGPVPPVDDEEDDDDDDDSHYDTVRSEGRIGRALQRAREQLLENRQRSQRRERRQKTAFMTETQSVSSTGRNSITARSVASEDGAVPEAPLPRTGSLSHRRNFSGPRLKTSDSSLLPLNSASDRATTPLTASPT
ncbi:hypothetical protein BDK51DRAFT_33105, partial [Blyttiomyces helicus]